MTTVQLNMQNVTTIPNSPEVEVMRPSPIPPLPTKKLRSEVNSQRSKHRSQTDQTLLMD